MNPKKIIASITGEEFAEELFDSPGVQEAREKIEGAVLDAKLDELIENGVDQCTVCGDEVDIQGAETWDDIHAILEEHAHERQDHLYIAEKGWVLDPDNGDGTDG